LENPRSEEEYAFELLNFGILWRAYGYIALSVKIAPFHLLVALGDWRKKYQQIKSAIDILRGILMSFFLVPHKAGQMENAPQNLQEISGKMHFDLSGGWDFGEHNHGLNFLKLWNPFGCIVIGLKKRVFSVWEASLQM
jgi:hypothetical protein